MRHPFFLAAAGFLLLAIASYAAIPPAVTNPAATPRARGNATIAVTVNAGGATTTVSFDYGLTADYGTAAGAVTTVDAAATSQRVERSITGLEVGKTYHYRATAVNSDGTQSTVDMTFVANVAPIAERDTAHIRTRLGSVIVPILANDFDPDEDPKNPGNVLFVSVTDDRPEGDVERVGDSVKYTATATFDGNDVVTYRIREKPSTALQANGVLQIVNSAPSGRADRGSVSGSGSISIAVLSNDTDSDNSGNARDPLTIRSFTQPANGTVTQSGSSLVYTPGAGFTGLDTFTYVPADAFAAGAGVTVTIGGARFAVAGDLGSVINDRDGRPVGYLRLKLNRSGSFSGQLDLGTKSFRVSGTLDAEGRFTGTARGDDGRRLPITLAVDLGDGGATLAGTFGGGRFTTSAATADLTRENRRALEGRYSVELPASGTSTGEDPDSVLPDDGIVDGGSGDSGTGWISVRLNDRGVARLKGKTGDGRPFSTRGVLQGTGEAPSLSFYAASRRTEITGELTLSDGVGGNVQWGRRDGDLRSSSANGEAFEQSGNGGRVLATESNDGGRITVTISGGGVPGFSREMRVSENNKPQTITEGDDGLQIRFDRKNGTFKGQFHVLSDLDRTLKLSGVLLPGEGRGSGLFVSGKRTGRVEVRVTTGTGGETPTVPPVIRVPGIPVPPIATDPDPVDPVTTDPDFSAVRMRR